MAPSVARQGHVATRAGLVLAGPRGDEWHEMRTEELRPAFGSTRDNEAGCAVTFFSAASLATSSGTGHRATGIGTCPRPLLAFAALSAIYCILRATHCPPENTRRAPEEPDNGTPSLISCQSRKCAAVPSELPDIRPSPRIHRMTILTENAPIRDTARSQRVKEATVACRRINKSLINPASAATTQSSLLYTPSSR